MQTNPPTQQPSQHAVQAAKLLTNHVDCYYGECSEIEFFAVTIQRAIDDATADLRKENEELTALVEPLRRLKDAAAKERDELLALLRLDQTLRIALKKQRDDLRHQLNDTLDALRELHAEQNGPPLISDAQSWTEAMRKAEDALRSSGETTHPFEVWWKEASKCGGFVGSREIAIAAWNAAILWRMNKE